MRKKRIMIIGPGDCGKTTIANGINGYEGTLIRRTQDTRYGEATLDVPGAYVENPDRYKHLISLAQDASHLLILVDQSRPAEKYSPGFAKAFRCRVIGVVTKSDMNPENEEICFRQLKKIGVEEPYFKVSASHPESMAALKKYLSENN